MGNVLSLGKPIGRARSEWEASLLEASIRLSVHEKLPLEEIYVELSLLSDKCLENLFKAASFSSRPERDGISSVAAGKDAAELPKVTFDQLFDGKGVRNVLVYGGAGSGKTTAFLLVLVYQWLQGLVLKDKFDLIVPFELRDKNVQKAESLDELFFLQLRSLGFDTEEAKEVSVQLCRSLDISRLCLVFDGLDECRLNSCSPFVRDLLLREAVPRMHVIVTSRPCPDANELKQTGAYTRHLEVAGFSVEKVHEYVLKALGKDRGEEMLKELENNSEMASLMSTPLFAALACQQFKHGQGVPRGACSLFSVMVCSICEKKAGRRYSSLQKIPSTEMHVRIAC